MHAGDDRVRADGRKELIAHADGYREPAESWADLQRDCARNRISAVDAFERKDKLIAEISGPDIETRTTGNENKIK